MRMSRRQALGVLGGLPAVLAMPRMEAAARPASSHTMALAQQTAKAVVGIDPADMDLTVSPRDDFYRFANGGWLDRTTIPSDRSSFGVLRDLTIRTSRQIIGLLENLAGSDALDEGTDEWKVVQFFQQGTDLATRNAQGIAPVQTALDRIAEIVDLEDLHAFLTDALVLGVPHFFGISVDKDLSDSSVYALYLDGPYLGMPNRDYYLDDTPSNLEAREAYIATCADLLLHAGHAENTARDDAEAVFELERRLAAETMTREEQQDFSLINNPVSVVELREMYPAFGWGAYFKWLGLENVSTVITTELGYMQTLGGILQDTPIGAIRDYLTLTLMWSAATTLSEEIEATAFQFSRALSGTDEQAPLEERVLDEIENGMSEALGKLYVAAYFPPEAKARISELVDQVVDEFGHRLERNAWMTDATRGKALEKLSKLGVKVGYPDVWRSFKAVEVADSFSQTALNASNADYFRQIAKYGTPVDNSEWEDSPHVVNAFYNFLSNDITFPAAILQAPLFDAEADPASNFGAIGMIIGHEITHGFDATGSQFNVDGNLASWWSPEDEVAFEALNQRVVEQYSAIEVLPGVFVDGQITIGENVADLGGVQVAHDALGAYLEANGSSLDAVLNGPMHAIEPEPEASPIAAFATPSASPVSATPVAVEAAASFTQRERFHIAAATAWRMKIRDAALTLQVQTDEHSPAEVRATQPIRNMDGFHETFETKPGDAMYIAPEDRLVIW
jgi:predicted metalloendopeptidase